MSARVHLRPPGGSESLLTASAFFLLFLQPGHPAAVSSDLLVLWPVQFRSAVEPLQ